MSKEPKILTWDDLEPWEQEVAKEQYLFIREQEEERARDEITEEYPEPIDWTYVKGCTFTRNKEDMTVDVWI